MFYPVYVNKVQSPTSNNEVSAVSDNSEHFAHQNQGVIRLSNLHTWISMDVLTGQYARLTDSRAHIMTWHGHHCYTKIQDIELYSPYSVVSSRSETIMVAVPHNVDSEHFAIMAFDDDTGHSQLQTSV